MGNKTDLLKDIFSDDLKKEAEKEEKPLSLEGEGKENSEVDLFDSTPEAQTEEESPLTLAEDSDFEKKPEKKPLKPLAPKVNLSSLKKKEKPAYKAKEMSAQLQMSRSQFGTVREAGGSPLQFNLIQSESLRLAQSKIANLEEELESLRRDNEKLVAAGEVLEERVEQLQVENEEFRREREESASVFSNEKEVLLSSMEEGRKTIARLEKTKKQLEKRLSRDLQSIRVRENSLENKIEIMKLENGVLQKEKDKMIIDLQRGIYKVKDSLKASQKKNQELQEQLGKIRESLRKTVSVLRATVNNLEGLKQQREDTSSSVKRAA